MPRTLLFNNLAGFPPRELSEAQGLAVLRRIPDFGRWGLRDDRKMRVRAQALPFLVRHELVEITYPDVPHGPEFAALASADEVLFLDGSSNPWSQLQRQRAIHVTALGAPSYVESRYRLEVRKDFLLTRDAQDLAWAVDVSPAERQRVAALIRAPRLVEELPAGRFRVEVTALWWGMLQQFAVEVAQDGALAEDTHSLTTLSGRLRAGRHVYW